MLLLFLAALAYGSLAQTGGNVAPCSYQLPASYSLLWTTQNGIVTFNLTYPNFPANSYTGVAFGDDLITGLDAILVQVNGSRVQVVDAKLTGYNSPQLLNDNAITTKSATYMNQLLSAQFSRPITLASNGHLSLSGCVTWNFFVTPASLNNGQYEVIQNSGNQEQICNIDTQCVSGRNTGGMLISAQSPVYNNQNQFQQNYPVNQNQPNQVNRQNQSNQQIQRNQQIQSSTPSSRAYGYTQNTQTTPAPRPYTGTPFNYQTSSINPLEDRMDSGSSSSSQNNFNNNNNVNQRMFDSSNQMYPQQNRQQNYPNGPFQPFPNAQRQQFVQSPPPQQYNQQQQNQPNQQYSPYQQSQQSLPYQQNQQYSPYQSTPSPYQNQPYSPYQQQQNGQNPQRQQNGQYNPYQGQMYQNQGYLLRRMLRKKRSASLRAKRQAQSAYTPTNNIYGYDTSNNPSSNNGASLVMNPNYKYLSGPLADEYSQTYAVAERQYDSGSYNSNTNMNLNGNAPVLSNGQQNSANYQQIQRDYSQNPNPTAGQTYTNNIYGYSYNTAGTSPQYNPSGNIGSQYNPNQQLFYPSNPYGPQPTYTNVQRDPSLQTSNQAYQSGTNLKETRLRNPAQYPTSSVTGVQRDPSTLQTYYPSVPPTYNYYDSSNSMYYPYRTSTDNFQPFQSTNYGQYSYDPQPTNSVNNVQYNPRQLSLSASNGVFYDSTTNRMTDGTDPCALPDPYWCAEYVNIYLNSSTQYDSQSQQTACRNLITSLQESYNGCCATVLSAGCMA